MDSDALLLRFLDEEISTLEDHIVHGGCQTHEDYRKGIAALEAYKRTKAKLLDIRSRLSE